MYIWCESKRRWWTPFNIHSYSEHITSNHTNDGDKKNKYEHELAKGVSILVSDSRLAWMRWMSWKCENFADDKPTKREREKSQQNTIQHYITLTLIQYGIPCDEFMFVRTTIFFIVDKKGTYMFCHRNVDGDGYFAKTCNHNFHLCSKLIAKNATKTDMQKLRMKFQMLKWR